MINEPQAKVLRELAYGGYAHILAGGSQGKWLRAQSRHDDQRVNGNTFNAMVRAGLLTELRKNQWGATDAGYTALDEYLKENEPPQLRREWLSEFYGREIRI